MSHRRAVLTMILVTLLWSIAGVVTRQLQAAPPFEVTFWRSAANALTLLLVLAWRKGPTALGRELRTAPRLIWASAACWTVMFTSFMLALTLTSVANVLITMSLAPLFTALISRFTLGHRLPARTWLAIGVAGFGIAWMYGAQVAGGSSRDLLGTLIALTVPMAGATMWSLLQRHAMQHPDEHSDMTLAVWLGSVASTLLTGPMAWPLSAPGSDIAWLCMLGVVQLAIPCLLAVRAGHVLSAPEASLLGLLEILFGVAWTWLGGTETPTSAVLGGGGLVLLALAANEGLALRRRVKVSAD